MSDWISYVLGWLLRSFRSHDLRGRRKERAPESVLLTQFMAPLGCCVHATPILGALREAFPSTKIIVSTRGACTEVLGSHPAVDTLLVTVADPADGWLAVWRVARELRRRMHALGLQPDLLLQDGSHRRGSFALLAGLLGVPSAGFGEAPGLYDRYLRYDPERSLITNNLRVVEAVSGRGVETFSNQPAVFFREGALRRSREMLLAAKGERIGFVMRGSGGQRTSWLPERFGQVLQWAVCRGATAILLGAQSDFDALEEIRRGANDSAINLAGRTTIEQLAAVVCLCDLLISIDTGTMHVGSAGGVPMVVLGPSWQKPVEWLPLGVENVRILRGEDRDDVPDNYHLDEICVDEVIAAAEELLRLYPASERSREERIERRLRFG